MCNCTKPYVSPHNYMDVNVELLSLEHSKRAKIIRSAATTCFALSFLTIFIEFSYNNYFTLGFVGLSVALILWLYIAGFPSMGKLTFSQIGLTIHHEQESQFLSLDDLDNSKISIQEYSGKTYPTFSLLDYDGTGNYMWLDRNNKNERLRFKLMR